MSFTFALIILLFNSGNMHNLPVRCGTFKVDRPNMVEQAYMRYFRGFTRYSANVELIVNCDSTFQYKACVICKGRWTTKNDSLFLHVSESRWTNDSLNKYGYKGKQPEVPSKPIGFRIRKDQLEQIAILKNGEKLITRLKFNEH